MGVKMHEKKKKMFHFVYAWIVHASSLRPPSLTRLATGATKPTGWLMDELTLQATGLSGALPNFWVYFNQSTWLHPKGGKNGNPAQFIPYYLNGLVPLSHQLEGTAAGDTLAEIRERYIGYILAAQNVSNATGRPAGWLGPDVPRHENLNAHNPAAHNYWSKYLGLEAIESYAEAASPTAAARATRALVAHQRQFWLQLSTNDPPLNYSRWGFARYSDGIVGMQVRRR